MEQQIQDQEEQLNKMMEEIEDIKQLFYKEKDEPVRLNK
jgi:hypothetical protein